MSTPDSDRSPSEESLDSSIETAETQTESDPPTESNTLVSALRSIWQTNNSAMLFMREILLSVTVVLIIGLLLFSISGLWPPMVAIESGSMEPHMSRYDLVFITAPDRFVGDGAVEGTGVVPQDAAMENEYIKFGDYGDVIVFHPDGQIDRVPIIHRAHFWVDEGENWYDRADPNRLGGAADCSQLQNCPAPHDGFITHGDANGVYDQVQGQSSPVKEEWIIGTANVRIPYLGWVRLTLSERGVVATGIT